MLPVLLCYIFRGSRSLPGLCSTSGVLGATSGRPFDEVRVLCLHDEGSLATLALQLLFAAGQRVLPVLVPGPGERFVLFPVQLPRHTPNILQPHLLCGVIFQSSIKSEGGRYTLGH